MARVAVVGAGLGGLAAAARLAALGHRVTVLEQADDVGGKLGWYARDGHAFDTGPSLLTLPQVYRDLFTATGGPLAESVDLVRLDPAVGYRFAD
ncbi:MAG: FAD-dependent oxidoreductase, partial [Blastococcus sp.]